jgi:hypothetical protein
MPKIVLLFKIQFSNKNSKLWNLQSDIKVIHKIGQTQHQKPMFTLSFMLSFLPLCCTEKTMFRHLTSTLEHLDCPHLFLCSYQLQKYSISFLLMFCPTKSGVSLPFLYTHISFLSSSNFCRCQASKTYQDGLQEYGGSRFWKLVAWTSFWDLQTLRCYEE